MNLKKVYRLYREERLTMREETVAVFSRFVPGVGVDEIALAYDASGTKGWYHEDAQGRCARQQHALGVAQLSPSRGSLVRRAA